MAARFLLHEIVQKIKYDSEGRYSIVGASWLTPDKVAIEEGVPAGLSSICSLSQ